MKKKLLITGGSGFIGRNLREQLADKYTIIAPSSKELNLLKEDEVLSFFKRHTIDFVIHSAVYAITRGSTKDPSQELYRILRMFFNVSRCHEYFDRMLYFGSGAEYDKRRSIASVGEDDFDKYVPADNYGFAKYICAHRVNALPNIFCLRLFGIYGKYEDWRIRFISNAICKTIFNMNITIKKNVYFDYLYVNDLVNIVDKFLMRKKFAYKQYNVCTGSRVDLKTLAQIILKTSNNKSLAMHIKEKGYANEYTGSNKRLLKLIGDFTFTPLNQSIAELYNWYNTNKTLIDRKKLLLDE